MYIIRLDDAAKNMNIANWDKIENMLDNYGIKPFVGVIPNNEDKEFLKYPEDKEFWKKVKLWQDKGWEICMHGYNHVCQSKSGGINPINERSEFAGNTYELQKEKIKKSKSIFEQNNIKVKIFFAPAHTFDDNTLKALNNETNIRIISDTIANDVYYEKEFYFIPQQSGGVRNLPFNLVTFCYHPNNMTDEDFKKLENFLIKNKEKFVNFSNISLKKRNKNLYDNLLKKIYFIKRKIINKIKRI